MSDLHTGTPNGDGFRMPGEHEPHQAILMAWPHRPDNWRDNAGPAKRAFTELAVAIDETTPVIMCASPEHYDEARAMLPEAVDVVAIASDDSWMRDIGPSYVVNEHGELRGVDWPFNAWGGVVNGLYDNWDQDDALASTLLALRGEGRYRAPLVLEGGSVHVDGEGTCITTAECLLHPGRNPELDQADISEFLREYLGVTTIIWLPNGLYNDETDGHVDNILHFVRPGEVILTWCNDPDDPMYAISRSALAALESQTDAQGRSITIHKLPMPGPLFITPDEAAGVESSSGMNRSAGVRLAASYTNLLITNGRVIFPLLDADHDDEVAQILGNLFPDREVVGVEARELLLGGGNIHCVTQQVPVSGPGDDK